MGKLALAAKITHVPSLYLSELPGPRQDDRRRGVEALAEGVERGVQSRCLGVDLLACPVDVVAARRLCFVAADERLVAKVPDDRVEHRCG